MKAQTIFNRVMARLTDGTGRAIDPKTDFCKYRTADGKACAVGIFLTDKEYNSAMENFSVEDLISKGSLPARLEEHQGLLENLQSLHDDGFNWDGNTFIAFGTARRIAEEHGLTVPQKYAKVAKVAS